MSRIQDLENRLKSLGDQVAHLESKVNELQDINSITSDQIKQLDKDLQDLKKRELSNSQFVNSMGRTILVLNQKLEELKS